MTDEQPGAGPVERIVPGTRLGDWRVSRFVSRGGFGSVFAAAHVDDPGVERALKVFDPVLSWAARSTLLREFEVLTGIRDEHLLRGHDAFDLPSGPYAGCVVFVLDLADGDLASDVARRGPLPAPEVAAAGAQVARGLTALHDAGHLHGDVKPPNVLRVGPRWLLGDFGVTTVIEGSYAVTSATTLDFRPPELSMEEAGARVHRASDVWALGITLWVAATGRHPFVGSDPHLRYAAVLRGDRATGARPDEPLAELLEAACLAEDPRARSRAADLAEDLLDLYRPEAAQPSQAATTRPESADRTLRDTPFAVSTRPESADRTLRDTPFAVSTRPESADRTVRDVQPVQARPESPDRTVRYTAPDTEPPAGREPADRAPAADRTFPLVAGVLAAVLAGVAVEMWSQLAALLSIGLAGRRAVYLAGVVATLAAAGALVRHRLRSAPRVLGAAAAAAALVVICATAYLFLGAG